MINQGFQGTMVNDHGEAGVDSMELLGLASRWRSGPEWERMMEELESEPVPSHLNTINSSGLFHIVSTDKMTVKYVGNPQHGHDVGAVQADCPAPTRRFLYYFEMTVKNAGQKGQMAIGFTMQHFKMRRQPGWEENSCGYHGDDGHLYRGKGKGESFGPKFTSGDTIGAGINYASQQFFFTKNAEIVGTVGKDIKGPLYPTISVHSQNEELTVNFKQQFLFDIEAFMLAEKIKQKTMIEKISLPPNVSHWIVRSYLLHYGYQDTLNAFDIASESNCPPVSIALGNGINVQRDMYALNHRKVLRQLIMDGDIDSAFQKLREWYPQVLQDETSAICFLLHSQRFIEYIRVGHQEDAVAYGQDELKRFLTVKPFSSLLKDIVALLAYDKPMGSCVGYLLNSSQREFVADAVNAVVLSTNPGVKDPGGCMYSCLERLLRQLTICSLERRVQNEGQGEVFYLHRELDSSSNRGRGKY